MKKIAKSLIRQLGYDVCNVDSKLKASFEAQHSLITSMGINRPIIFDVGAHRGKITTKYRQLFPNSIIYCFEPFPDSFEVLKNRFSCDSKIKLIPAAVSEVSGQRKFFVNYRSATNSLLPRPFTLRKYYPEDAGPKTEIQVPVLSIDDFVSTKKIKKIDVLKLDIQGGELMALKGAIQTLKKGNASLVYLEIMFVPHYENMPLFYELWNFLETHQYTLFDIYNLKRAKNGQLRQGDALFVSRQVRLNIVDQLEEIDS